jgi:hypothetical protein
MSDECEMPEGQEMIHPESKKEGWYWVQVAGEPDWEPAWFIEPDSEDDPGDWWRMEWHPTNDEDRHDPPKIVRVGASIEPPKRG